VDSRLPALDVRPWRTATLVASAVAAVELALLVVAALVLLAKPLSHRVSSAAAAHVAAMPKAKTPAAPAKRAKPKPKPVRLHLSRAHTHVLVLNGNGRTGAAGQEAAQVQRFGYPVERVADAARMDYPASVVMFRPGFAAEGKRLAHDLRIGVVGPLDGLSVRELGHAQVAVVVGH
jgi:LytR cell envelope-related transcriptional attenuator